MRRKPVRQSAARRYPRYGELDRTCILRWIGVGGVALAVGGVGCDRIGEALGLRSSQPTITTPVVHMDGDMVAIEPTPPPVPAGDDDDSADSTHGASGES